MTISTLLSSSLPMERGVASHSRQEVLDALAWLTGAGIDTIVSDCPRAWLQPDTAPPAETAPSHEPTEETRQSRPSPQISPQPSPLIVEGPSGASIALVVDADPRAGAKTILAGVDAALLIRMMAAIGLNVEEVIRLGLPPASGKLPTGEQIAGHGASSLLLLGDGPTKALLGKPVSQARGQAHRLELGGRQVAVVATFAPAFLIQQPRLKALAWADLRLFAGLVRQ